MEVRVNTLMRELEINLSELQVILQDLGYDTSDLMPNTKVSGDVAYFVRCVYSGEGDLLDVLTMPLEKAQFVGHSIPMIPQEQLPVIRRNGESESTHSKEDRYAIGTEFWIEEIVVSADSAKRISFGALDNDTKGTRYTAFIGSNGVGKSSLMRDVVNFFLNLHANTENPSITGVKKKLSRVIGVKYHMDGEEYVIVKLGKSYYAHANKQYVSLKDLTLPKIVACHFGAFEKFPVPSVKELLRSNTASCYSYVGAHASGNMISSSAIAFRLLATLNEDMNEEQRLRVCSLLDFIGYSHKISLQYQVVTKQRKNLEDLIVSSVQSDRDFRSYTGPEKQSYQHKLLSFYYKQQGTDNALRGFTIDFDKKSNSQSEELKLAYKLKQYDLISSLNVIFYKGREEIVSDNLSSGEFIMLSAVLSIAAAVKDSHTLVLFDEPELSQHPNWQMSLISNLDRALNNQSCHVVIATHSHMIVSDLPMNRSSVLKMDKDENGICVVTPVEGETYGWSAEEVLLKVFNTATDRNRYFGERIGKLIEKMGEDSIDPEEVEEELNELEVISRHLSDVDPMKAILMTIIDTYRR